MKEAKHDLTAGNTVNNGSSDESADNVAHKLKHATHEICETDIAQPVQRFLKDLKIMRSSTSATVKPA